MKKTSEPQKISEPDQKNKDQQAVSTGSPGLFFHHNTTIWLIMFSLTLKWFSYLLEIPNDTYHILHCLFLIGCAVLSQETSNHKRLMVDIR